MAIITIGGNIGAGKTTLAAKLVRALDYEELYMGHVFRELAREKGISIEAFYEAIKDDPELERKLDDRQRKLMQEKENIVVQGRIAWFFAKESTFPSFNVFLKVDPKIGAVRSGERKENSGKSPKEMMQMNAMRETMERDRYKNLYGIENFQDPGHYDFVIDTSKLTLDEAFKKVLEKIKEKLDDNV